MSQPITGTNNALVTDLQGQSQSKRSYNSF